MSNDLAEQLMSAESAESFLRSMAAQLGPRAGSVLKSAVDHLVRVDLNEAERLAGRIEELAVLAGEPLLGAYATAGRARILHNHGRVADAIERYRHSARALARAGQKSDAALVTIQQVYALAQLGRYDAALRLGGRLRQKLHASEKALRGQLETNLGNVHYYRGRYSLALRHYDTARELLADSRDETAIALIDFSRSNVLAEFDRHSEARECLSAANRVFERHGHAVQAAQSLFHLAYLDFRRGAYSSALAGYTDARERLMALGSDQLVAWCSLEIAEILLALNAFDDSVKESLSAQSGFSTLGMEYEEAKSRMVTGLGRLGEGSHELAGQEILAARETFSRLGDRTYVAQCDLCLAEVALKRGDPVEGDKRSVSAERYFRARGLLGRAGHARLLSARSAYHAGHPSLALRRARAALRLAQTAFDGQTVLHSHHLIGVILRDRGQRAAALESFRRAVEVIDGLRGGVGVDEFKSTFLRDKIEVYEDAIAACLDQGDDSLLDEAFRLVESAKSRALAEMMLRLAPRSAGPRVGPDGDGRQQSRRERLEKLLESLSWFRSRAGREEDKGDQRGADMALGYRRAAAGCERQITTLYRQIESASDRAAGRTGVRSGGVEQIQAEIQDDELAVEYFLTGGRVSAFVVTGDAIRVVRDLASCAAVDEAVSALRFQLEKFNYGAAFVEAHFGQLKKAADSHLRKLYELLVAPLMSLLTVPNLIIIPHGVLHYVPFHALRTPDGYLIDDYAISYAPSGTVLVLCRERRKRSTKAAGFGGRKRGLVALGIPHGDTPFVEHELGALSRLFPRGVTLAAAEATRANLVRFAPRARYLHLASHGYFRRDNPMFSFLRLADAPLHFYSVVDLKLDAELVTLSACHTGVNRVFPGDELHGLMRGFLHAGATSLVASLWAVNDRSTATLMEEFYSRIAGGESKRSALRAAQHRVKDEYGHPYYWAPFVLLGATD